MSFVKDDHSYTRGVGAVAAMDAGSSRRRRAAALGAVRMARRDAKMARQTLGRISQVDTGDGGGGSGGGGSTGGSTRPTLPTRFPIRPIGVQPLPPKPVPVPPKINIRDFATIRNLAIGVRPDVRVVVDPVKLPGAQVVDVKPEPAPPPKDQVLPPPKQTTVIVGGGGPMPLPPKPAAPSGGGFPGFAPEPEIDVTVDAQPVTAAPAAKKPNYLLYAALGIGAYWLLTRKG